MGPKTPCPDLMLLRLLFGQPASTPETDSVQAHLEHCEVCRAIVAGLEDGENIQNTVADEGVVRANHVMPPTDASAVFPVSNRDTGNSPGDATVCLPDGAAQNGATIQLSNSAARRQQRGRNRFDQDELHSVRR